MITKTLFVLLAFTASVAAAQKSVTVTRQAVIGSSAPQTKRIGPNPLVGTWRLIRYADTPKGGVPVYVFGENPIGYFTFTGDGYVSIHIMHNPPNPEGGTIDPDPDACIPGWYCAYFGTYSVDPKGTYWVTHVTGGNILSYIGTDQKRSFKIDGDKMTIVETYTSGATPVTAERVLTRAPAMKK